LALKQRVMEEARTPSGIMWQQIYVIILGWIWIMSPVC
jgi:hypothetical protein